MNGTELKQRLAAILAADVAGYSRLMAADERATVAALDTARKVFRSHIESNQGRVIDMAGDSVLAVFETATGAVSAALTIQQELNASSSAVPEDRRMQFRIGVHLGDIIEKSDGTVYGDGVNIAARLQALADPGGITVSDSVRNAVKGNASIGFQDMGEQQVKNIPEPVRSYRVSTEGSTAPKPSHAVGEIDLSLPDKPSIAVLPFTNMSGDPEQEYFADGMVEDIITELSRFQRLFVIARNTSFTFKGRSVDVKKIALELGVHFVLEGSVRKAGNRVRITAQLIDGETGRHVWAERYEDVLSDVFELQERITRQVVGSMVPEIEAEEMRLLERGKRRFNETDDIAWRAMKAAYDAMFTGHAALTLEAISLADQAIDKDRNCRLAWYVLGYSHAVRVFFGWTDDRRGSLDAARRAAETLMDLAPNDSRSYSMRGWVAIQSADYARGAADLRKAHGLNPNDATILFLLVWTEASDGNVERARECGAQALRISPKDRRIGLAHLAYAMAAFVEQNFKELRDWAELAIQSHPSAPIRRLLMIAYAAEVSDMPLLRAHLEKVQSVAPDFIPSLFRGDYLPYHRPEHMKMLLDSLRKAGLGN
jgi:adenylate cyclase